MTAWTYAPEIPGWTATLAGHPYEIRRASRVESPEPAWAVTGPDFYELAGSRGEAMALAVAHAETSHRSH
jgi:hypothetical protein